jgi:hypothetical protein
MFRKLTQVAGDAAISVSRRQFLGRLGRGSLIAVGVVAGILAVPEHAEAAKCPAGWHQCGARGFKKKRCCPPGYHCQPYHGSLICCPNGRICR